MNSALHTYQKKLEQTCSAYSNKTAITYLRDSGSVEDYSYQDMFGYITKVSRAYEDMGLKKGDRVAVILPPAPWAYFSIMGLAYFGATSVILDGGLQKDELHRLIIDADVSMIITSAPIYREKLIDSDVSVLDAYNSWKQLNDKEIKHVIDPDTDAIAILYSSGTTSSAKGVVIGYEQEMNAIEYLYGIVGTNEIKYLMIFPNSHVSGFTDFLAILLNGGSLANIENTSSSKLTEAFQIYKPTMFGMVPKVWDVFKEKIVEGIGAKGKSAQKIFKLIEICGKIRRLTGINLGRKLFKSINDEVFGGHMQIMHVGGGKSNPETGLFFWKLGYDWSDFYASTEANIPITVTTGKDIDKGVGSISLNPNAAIKINNSDVNGIGEVCVKNNMLMKGYFRDEKLTEEAFVDGYFKTGDAGYIKDGFLYITGRIKENIVLKNGEKVSPDDVETAYRGIVGEAAEFAIVGITNDELYDDIWCFVEGKEGSDEAQFEVAKNSVDANYRYVRLVYVDSIPKTSIGKVKRYELKKLAANIPKNDVTVRDEKDVLGIIQSFCPNIEVREDSRLKEDLGIDSLTMFEIVCEIERRYKIKIANSIENVKTVSDVEHTLLYRINLGDEKSFLELDKYPESKSEKVVKRLKSQIKLIGKVFKCDIKGTEHIRYDKNVIICSNHMNLLDPYWVLLGMDKEQFDYANIACAVAVERFAEQKHKQYIKMLGGIPIDRDGNSIPSMQKMIACTKEGYSLIIFPEGARSRDGKMLPIKSGVARIAAESGTPILPVRIDGGFEIWPRHKRKPSIFDWKKFRRHRLSITYKPLIEVDSKSEEEIMEELAKAISE